MVFSSFGFLLLFLPPVVVGYHLTIRYLPERTALWWLIAASLVFYAQWNVRFALVLIFSCLINAAMGAYLLQPAPCRRTVLALGLTFNLGMLGYFKYANFFLATVNDVTGSEFPTLSIILPIGISFFVFQKVAFLFDAYRGEVRDFSLQRFILFVFFFPQLIAGPIVHHSELMPQLRKGFASNADLANVALGLSILIVGLGKKVLVADGLAGYATPVFDAAAAGVTITLIEAWCATVAYSLQLYFDFSGYSDMAIGLAMLFGIHLPINFNSPYKAASLIDFWRRWHMTLSRFLRDYLYVPLGGNRKGEARRLLNLFIVMLVGGLWHGAGWTFVLWGAIHGIGLVFNHLYRSLVPCAGRWGGLIWPGRIATLLFVTLAWVPFRAADLKTTWSMFRGLGGLNGVLLPDTYAVYLNSLAPALQAHGVRFEPAYLFKGVAEVGILATLCLVVLLLPNTQEWFGYDPAPNRRKNYFPRPNSPLTWRPTAAWAVAFSGYAIACLIYTARGGEFLYFRF